MATIGTGTSMKKHKVSWGLPMVLGVLMIILGFVALGASMTTSLVSIMYIGVLLVAVGIMEVIAAFRVGRAGHWLTYLLAGILSIVVGGLCLDKPLASLGSLTLLIAGFLFAAGLFRGITSIVDRYPRWGIDFLYGVVALALGVYIVASWPISSMWVLGTVVGAEILVRGMTLVAASLALRRVEHGGVAGDYVAA